jgi:phosphoribosylformimino-5-aminoimidazole carboxamide ribotide isomerase
MILYPAIDILGGKTVRLERGDFARRRDYDDDPLAAARRWVEQGAARLHVVDLDGAKRGRPVNLEHLGRISGELGEATELIQYGGGLRTLEDAMAAVEAGADRVVLGTAAFLSPRLLAALLSEEADRVAVGVDVRAGSVAVHGWQERTQISADEAIRALLEAGVRTVVYTDVDRDGMLEGIDPSFVKRICVAAADRRLIYSGGIGSLNDLEALVALGLPNLEGVIVGKALYEGRFTVGEAQAILSGEPARAPGSSS